MRSNLCLIVVLLCTSLSTHAQIVRKIHETFDAQPRYWSFASEYSDSNLVREYKRGAMQAEVKNGSNFWSLAYKPIDGTKPWSVSTNVVIEKSPSYEGLGIMVVVDGEFFMFKVSGGNRATWLGRWTQKGNVWLTISAPGVNNRADRSCDCVKPNGQVNELTVRAANGRIAFLVNGTVVEDHALEGPFDPIKTKVDAVGTLISNNVKGRFESFDAEYTERPLPIIEGAFLKAQKTIVNELKGVSSRYPVMSPNGQNIYYVITDPTTSDDAWEASALTDSTWAQGKRMGVPINNTAPNNVISVSQDGNDLLLWGRYKADGSTDGGGFSTSRRTATGWSVPTAIVAPPYQNKASSREECMTADRSVMILTREIEGNTNGQKDLYVSFRQADGSYGPLQNLGPAVNSSANEGSPFLAADGKTLYFSSPYQTYGSDDIYVSKRLDDTWLHWSPRVNMGPYVNTPNWDSYFCIHPSGKYAYMNSSDGINDGIVRISLPRDASSVQLLPEPVVIVKGRVFHARTKAPLAVDIKYEDLTTNTNIGSAVSEPNRGAYSMVLTAGRSYGFYAEKSGFFPVSDNIDLPSIASYQEIERDLYLEPIEVGSTIRLNNLFFDTDKSALRPQSERELRRLIAMLTSVPTMRIVIEGHTDDRGTDAHNKALSQSRADAVMAYLVQQGIAKDRCKAEGFGKSRPLTTSTAAADRQKNRRVDFRIVSM
jgi:outer membrane protein OmpA-like peptidoglycan-associated protein